MLDQENMDFIDNQIQEEKPKWYETRCYDVSVITSGFVRLGLLITIIVLSVKTNQYSGTTNSTILTQTLDDWKSKSWIDFTWSPNGRCPLGFEPIGILWEGIYPYNVTDTGLEVQVYESKFVNDYPGAAGVYQTKLFSGTQDALCGKRG